MFKKIFLAALAIGAGLFVLNHTKIGSYGHTAWNKAKKSVKGQVPLEFEIDRVREQVQMLVPDMRKQLGQVAEEIVAIDNLKQEVATMKVNLAKQKETVRVMTDDLKAGNEKITYTGIRYSREFISEKLAKDIKSCVRCEEGLKAKESLLEHKERALEAAREQLASMRSQKEELEVQIQQIEADVKAERLRQTKSTLSLDDSRLSEIKRSLQEIRNRLKVESVRSDLEGQFSPDLNIKIEKKKSADEVIREAESYLNGNGHETDGAKADARK